MKTTSIRYNTVYDRSVANTDLSLSIKLNGIFGKNKTFHVKVCVCGRTNLVFWQRHPTENGLAWFSFLHRGHKQCAYLFLKVIFHTVSLSLFKNYCEKLKDIKISYELQI